MDAPKHVMSPTASKSLITAQMLIRTLYRAH